MNDHPGSLLRRQIEARRGLLVPGAGNALAARVIEDLGFEAVYLSGAGLTNQLYGLPDLGFVGLAELAQHTAAIRDAVALPLIVDADTGFGNAVNVAHTTRVLERAGANAMQIEDQVAPKRCGHFAGQAVIACREMEGKIKAALDTRRHGDFLVIARTDARAALGLDAALERAARYAEAGADAIFVEAPAGVDELRRIAALPCPQVLNMVLGGRTPPMAPEERAALGFGLVLYANAALQGAVRGMTAALSRLKQDGELTEDPALVSTFAERQAVVRKPLFDALGERYA